MNPSQNVLKMSTVSPDTQGEMATLVTDGCNNNRMSVFFIRLKARLQRRNSTQLTTELNSS